MKNELKIVSGFFLGILAGAAAGVLFAPASGRRTRKNLRNKTKHLVDDTKEVIAEKVDTAVSSINHSLDQYSKKGKDSLSKIKEKMAAH